MNVRPSRIPGNDNGSVGNGTAVKSHLARTGRNGMDLFRIGDALLRSSPLLPFLAPSAYRPAGQRVAAAVRHRKSCVAQCHAQFSSSSRTRAEEHPNSSRRVPEQALDSISSLLNSAPEGPKSPSNPNLINRRRPEISPHDRNSGAVDELLQMMKSPTRPQRPQGSRPTPSILNNGYNIQQMLDPTHYVERPSSSPPTLDPAPMKLDSTVGRVVKVNPARGMDVGRVFRALDIQCARNRVKRDAQMQRFHERAGMKRKRLKSERWRRRFKENFTHTVQMVQRMRKQGW